MTLPMDELAQTLFEEAGDGLYFFDPQDGHILDVNPMAQRLTGYCRQELLCMSVKALFSSEVAGGMARLFHAYKSTGLFHSQEGFRLRCPGGTIPVNLTVTRIHAPERTLGLITARDITERRQAEEALRRSEQYYRNVFENAHDPILLLEPKTERVLDVNRRACELYGFERQEFLGLSLKAISANDADAAGRVADALSAPGCHHFETVHRRKDGTLMCLEVNSSVVTYGDRQAILTINRDVTERKRLEDQLRQAQKMEAVGQLAGGIAHDFNNLLTVVIGYSECLMADLPRQAANHQMAKEIRQAAQRAAELTGQLLAFGRKAIVAPKVLELNAEVRQTEKMLRRLIGEDIELAITLDTEDLKICMDAGQLHQVILNLTVNARDAMPQGGRLTIATTQTIWDEEAMRTKRNLPPGPYAILSVSDTGCGMSPEVLSHIFEPFFTTKEVGKGTGLGLATAYSIIEQGGGHIEVETKLGQGSTFHVYLPQAEVPASDFDMERSAQSGPGAETVLLVEDEPMVRTYTGTVLRERGYHVLEAANGPEALQLCSEHIGPLHLLLTDVVLPKLSGRELAQRTVALRPGLRVLFMSGYTGDTVLRHGVVEAEVQFLAKPFTPKALANKVRQVLDTPAPPKQADVLQGHDSCATA
jgi:two-component system cell cycle sensor histidine kinase/response regulator CckA